MWVNEKIFSKGDLNNTEEYLKEINYEVLERYEHIENMIDRLLAEQDMLEEKFIYENERG